MAYQIYRIGEWERVGGVDGYSTIRAYLEPGLYETQAFARKKSARLADKDYENGGDGSFAVVAVGESPFSNTDAPWPLTRTLERANANRTDIDTRPRPSSARSQRIAASSQKKPA